MRVVTLLRPATAGGPRLAARASGALPVAAGTAVTAVTIAALLDSAFGLYAADGVALVSGLLSAGLALFLILPGAELAGPALRRLLLIAVTTSFAASLLTVPLDIMVVGGRGLAGLGDALARSDVLRSDDYQAVLIRCVGLVALALAAQPLRLSRPARLLQLAGALVVAGSFLVSGHARTHGPGVVVAVCGLAHVLGVAAWLGGLAGLSVTLRRVSGAAAGRLVTTFATLMTGVVMMLFAGGLGLAFLYLPGPGALLTTAYGQVLLVKVATVSGVVVLSAANHHRFVPLAANGSARALRTLRLTVAVEQIALIAVIFMTEVLMRQNPGG